jgi:tripartite-type tricarboxylate transporter receptor subunit TctC
LALTATSAAAQTYPTRPVTLIVPFAAGGPTDIVARIVGEYYSKTLGQQFIVENIAGAGGTTGITRAAQAKPDGYTIAMGHMGTHGAAPALYPNIKYDPTKDFEPIGLAAGTPILIVARKDFPAADLKEFIAKAKDTGTRLSQAHAGVGSVSFTTCTLLTSQLGVKHHRVVAYRGTGPALNDLVGGQIDYMVDQSLNVIPQIKADTIKVYAIAAPERLESIPHVPTTKELGVDFIFSAWNAMVAPKGTPKEIVDKLADALSKALDDATIRERYVELGSTAPQGADRGPAGLQKLVESEMARITPVLKASMAAAPAEKK